MLSDEAGWDVGVLTVHELEKTILKGKQRDYSQNYPIPLVSLEHKDSDLEEISRLCLYMTR